MYKRVRGEIDAFMVDKEKMFTTGISGTKAGQQLEVKRNPERRKAFSEKDRERKDDSK